MFLKMLSSLKDFLIDAWFKVRLLFSWWTSNLTVGPATWQRVSSWLALFVLAAAAVWLVGAVASC